MHELFFFFFSFLLRITVKHLAVRPQKPLRHIKDGRIKADTVPVYILRYRLGLLRVGAFGPVTMLHALHAVTLAQIRQPDGSAA